MGPFWPPRWPWDGRDGSTGTQNTSTQCAWVVRIHIMCLGPLRDLYGTPRAPKRARFGTDRPFWGPRRALGSPGGPYFGPSATGWSNWVGHIHIMCLGPLRDLYGPFGDPGGPLAAPGGLILAQVPLVGPARWTTSISCAQAPYDTTTALLGPPRGPILAQKDPFGGPGGP